MMNSILLFFLVYAQSLSPFVMGTGKKLSQQDSVATKLTSENRYSANHLSITAGIKAIKPQGTFVEQAKSNLSIYTPRSWPLFLNVDYLSNLYRFNHRYFNLSLQAGINLATNIDSYSSAINTNYIFHAPINLLVGGGLQVLYLTLEGYAGVGLFSSYLYGPAFTDHRFKISTGHTFLLKARMSLLSLFPSLAQGLYQMSKITNFSFDLNYHHYNYSHYFLTAQNDLLFQDNVITIGLSSSF